MVQLSGIQLLKCLLELGPILLIPSYLDEFMCLMWRERHGTSGRIAITIMGDIAAQYPVP